MSSADAEAAAYLAWVQALLAQHSPSPDADAPPRSYATVHDLCDGVALFDLLADIDPDLFRNPHGADVKDNWVLTIGTLKRLYKLMMQYYHQHLRCAPQPLPQPDLNAIARSNDLHHLNSLCLLAIGIAVQSDENDRHIAAIQTLPQEHQHQLMMAIARIMEAIKQGQEEAEEQDGAAVKGKAGGADGEGDSDEDDDDGEGGTAANGHSKQELAQQLARACEEKATLEKAYIQLAEDHRNLQESLQESQAETRHAAAEHAAYRKQIEESRNEQADVLMRQEIERLKLELRKSEDNLAAMENDHEKLTKQHSELTRRADDLQRRADEGERWKDQLDEYRHAAERLQKAENAIEKYKKKLEEGADIRRQLKALEDQNADLVNRNASLEDEYKRVSAFKPLMDSYKTQIAELEAKASNLQRDLNTAKYEQDQVLSRLRASEDQRAKEKEEMELYQDRIRELELGGGGDGDGKAAAKRKRAAAAAAKQAAEAGVNGAEGLVAADASFASAAASSDDDDDDDVEGDNTGELEDALTGTTMTDLKIRVRQLTRDLEAARTNKADQSRLIVLENLLEDAQRMKARYESDYLREHRDKLVLQNQLEAIRAGKSDLGDGTEAAYALRLRLNEVVDELDAAKRELATLQVQHEQITRELTIAKSDLTLVNKDQVDILHSLRASIEVEKDELLSTIGRLKTDLAQAHEANRMSMAQVNTLLMEKVDLQTEGIGQRDEALRRERTLGDLKAKLSGKGLSKEVEDLVSSLQLEALNNARDVKVLQDKFSKAKTFIKQQDRMIKEKEREVAALHLSDPSRSGGGGAGDEETEKRNRKLREEVSVLRREQRLMMSAYQDLGRRYMVELESSRVHSSSASGVGGGAASAGALGAGSRGLLNRNAAALGGGSSWLGRQRESVNPTLKVASRR